MARPKKQGLDAFQFDIDTFSDERVSDVSRKFGAVADAVLIHLLCDIYRNGYFVAWDECYCLKLSKRLSVDVETTVAIVLMLVENWVFDKDLFETDSVLTSEEIQRRFFSASRRRKSEKELPYLLECDKQKLTTVNNNPENGSNLTQNNVVKNSLCRQKPSYCKHKPGLLSTETRLLSTETRLLSTETNFNSVKSTNSLARTKKYDLFNKQSWKENIDDVDIKENQEKSSSSPSSVRIFPLREIPCELAKERLWVEALMRSNSLDEEQLDVKIHEICQEWAAMGITHKTLQDAKRHVYNTLNVKRAAGELANAKRWNTVLYDMMRPYLESCGYDKETAKAFGEHYNVVMPDGRRLFVALENFERDIVPRMVEFKNRLGNENRDTG